MSLLKRFTMFAAILPLAAGLMFGQVPEKVELRILHYNDFHSQNIVSKITKTDSAGGKRTIEVGGTAVLKAYIDRARAEKPNTLLLHAGDDFQGSPVCAVTRGGSQIELLELMQPDVMTLGNHEFDYGADTLRALLKHCTFPIVSANLWDKSIGAPFVPRYRVLERGGLRIGVIGLAPPELKTLSLRDNVRDLEVLETDMTVRQAIAELRANFGTEFIVLLSHMGVEEDTAIARRVPGINVIVGGHSHTALFKPLRVGDTWIVQAGAKGRWLGVLDLVVNRAQKRIESGWGSLVETRAADVTPDPVIARAVAAQEARIDAGFREVLGRLETDWTRSHGPRESNIGSWQADALRAFAKTDIAFQNSGGIRKDLPAGPITVRDLWEISPFGNEIVTFELTGAQLRTALEMQGGKQREFCQVSGLRYTYDRAKAPSDALQAEVNGAPIDPARRYTVATNSFVGGHLHDFFNLPEKDVLVKPAMPALSDRDVFIEAVRAQKTIRAVTDGRIRVLGIGEDE